MREQGRVQKVHITREAVEKRCTVPPEGDGL